MRDGIILVDGKTIGTFVIDEWPAEGLRFKFEEGLKVREYLEHAADNGLNIALQLTPEFGEEIDGSTDEIRKLHLRSAADE